MIFTSYVLGFPKDYFRHHIQRIVLAKWSWISGNWERFFFILGIPSKISFIFYTSITSWENLKYLYKVFFQKFIGLLSQSSISKSDIEALELNQRKIRHGFWQEMVQLQKHISFFAQLSPARICRRDCLRLFFNGPHYFSVLCKSWQIRHIRVC